MSAPVTPPTRAPAVMPWAWYGVQPDIAVAMSTTIRMKKPTCFIVPPSVRRRCDGHDASHLCRLGPPADLCSQWKGQGPVALPGYPVHAGVKARGVPTDVFLR